MWYFTHPVSLLPDLVENFLDWTPQHFFKYLLAWFLSEIFLRSKPDYKIMIFIKKKGDYKGKLESQHCWVHGALQIPLQQIKAAEGYITTSLLMMPEIKEVKWLEWHVCLFCCKSCKGVVPVVLMSDWNRTLE